MSTPATSRWITTKPSHVDVHVADPGANRADTSVSSACVTRSPGPCPLAKPPPNASRAGHFSTRNTRSEGRHATNVGLITSP